MTIFQVLYFEKSINIYFIYMLSEYLMIFFFFFYTKLKKKIVDSRIFDVLIKLLYINET